MIDQAKQFIRFLLALAVLLAVGCQAPEPEARLHVVTGETMGTTYTVKVVDEGLREDLLAELPSIVQGELDNVNAKMSHYLPDSELSRLNRWQGEDPFPISRETMTVLGHARDISRLSGGAFDITVAPLVDAWGFGPPGQPPEPPSVEEIDRLLDLVGWEKVELDQAAGTVNKSFPELTLDLSAIAKGYGVDQVAEALDRAGVESYMVEVGGEVRTRGLNDEGEAWRIAIERPDTAGRALHLVIPLSDLALATSGDYRNYYEIDGRRISHTIDPRTGHPITHRFTSASVVTSECVQADAWATALLVLGPDGIDLAEDLGLAAFFLERNPDGGFVEHRTTAFDSFLDRQSE
ncbi:MAG: FAD:protein FMN transferase [Thermoanaerobaculia bacterium]